MQNRQSERQPESTGHSEYRARSCGLAARIDGGLFLQVIGWPGRRLQSRLDTPHFVLQKENGRKRWARLNCGVADGRVMSAFLLIVGAHYNKVTSVVLLPSAHTMTTSLVPPHSWWTVPPLWLSLFGSPIHSHSTGLVCSESSYQRDDNHVSLRTWLLACFRRNTYRRLPKSSPA